MWHYDPIKGRFQSLQPRGRALDIERSGERWSLWYRRNTPPHRSLLIGKFDSVEQAKLAAQDLTRSLAQAAAWASD